VTGRNPEIFVETNNPAAASNIQIPAVSRRFAVYGALLQHRVRSPKYEYRLRTLKTPAHGRSASIERTRRMKRFILALGILAMTVPMSAQTSTWTPDKAHSEVDFSILHMSLSKVHGRFGISGGQIVWNEADITKSTVNMTIDVASVDTGVGPRDNDLKSANIFDVAQFPTATFVSTSVAKADKGLTVQGNLTLHGVTKPVTLQVEGPMGPAQGMGGKTHAGFSATTTISRSAFGIAAKMPNAVLGDDVQLSIELDVIKQ
jgi:polyisoprenoid-binding protein YceI